MRAITPKTTGAWSFMSMQASFMQRRFSAKNHELYGSLKGRGRHRTRMCLCQQPHQTSMRRVTLLRLHQSDPGPPQSYYYDFICCRGNLEGAGHMVNTQQVHQSGHLECFS